MHTTTRLSSLLLVACCCLSASTGAAQPTAQPLVQAGNFVYLGHFTLPQFDGTPISTERALNYGGYALGMGPDGQSLYVGCHDWHDRLARVAIAPVGERAAVITPCTEVANLKAVDPDPGNSYVLGGTLTWQGRLVVSAYAYYDGNGNAVASHFTAAPDLSAWNGPHRVGSVGPGLVGGYMGEIPAEWRALLGGPAVTGQCCIGIISRSSYGPSVSVFDPADLGTRTPVPSQMLLGYPDGERPLAGWEQTSLLFNGATRMGGVAFPSGSRSVLFVGRQGTGPFCYGDGQECGDPTDGSKGVHAFPYRHQVWAYDANDLLAVKQGRRKPWDLKPYATWPLQGMSTVVGHASMASATYDPATRRVYVAEAFGESPRIHVYQITTEVLPASPAAPPVELAVDVDGEALEFTWQPPETGAWSGFQLEVGSSAGRRDLAVVPVGRDATSLTLPYVPGRYFVRLRTIDVAGVPGDATDDRELRLSAPTASPQAPSDLRAEVAGRDVVLGWRSAGDDEFVTQYVLEAGTSSGLTDLVAAAPVGRSTAFVAAAVPPGTYFARIRARNPVGLSAPSREVSFTVGPPASLPGPPLALAASVSTARVQLTWSPPVSGGAAIGYLLEAGLAPGETVARWSKPPTGAARFTGVPPGTYFVRLRAYNAAGVSPASPEIVVTIP